MEHEEATALIRGAVATAGGTWADLGAGDGTFTRALASLLGPAGLVYAVDRDAGALRQISRGSRHGEGASIQTVVADFTEPMDLPLLDGMLLANSLHFVPYVDQGRVLARIATLLGEHGSLVVVEYERRAANRWVPYPVSFAALGALTRDVGLGEPALLASRPSRFTGSIYSAFVRR